jgi:hypothetical protein
MTVKGLNQVSGLRDTRPFIVKNFKRFFDVSFATNPDAIKQQPADYNYCILSTQSSILSARSTPFGNRISGLE